MNTATAEWDLDGFELASPVIQETFLVQKCATSIYRSTRATTSQNKRTGCASSIAYAERGKVGLGVLLGAYYREGAQDVQLRSSARIEAARFGWKWFGVEGLCIPKPSDFHFLFFALFSVVSLGHGMVHLVYSTFGSVQNQSWVRHRPRHGTTARKKHGAALP